MERTFKVELVSRYGLDRCDFTQSARPEEQSKGRSPVRAAIFRQREVLIWITSVPTRQQMPSAIVSYVSLRFSSSVP